MPVINFSGLASGIDTNALIDATSQATRQRRVVPLQREASELTETNDVLSELKGKLSSLQSKLLAFRSLNGGGVSKQVTSNNESVATGTASNSASANSYTVTVTQLARQSTVSFNDTYASDTEAMIPAINDGNTDAQRTLTISYGTGSNLIEHDFVLTSTTTVSSFVAEFNANFTGRASASLVNVGTTASPSYKIFVTSAYQGEDKGEINLTLDGAPDAGLSAWSADRETSQALNSQFTLSGIAGTIERQSNTVTDLITGVSIGLQGTGTSLIQIKADVSSTKSKVKEFVDAWNEVVTLINENDQIQISQDANGEVTNTFLPLASTRVDNSAIDQLRSALISIKSYPMDGTYTNYDMTDAEADAAGITIRIFSDIGITSKGRNADGASDGTLTFDEDSSDNLNYNFEKALDAEPDSVSRLLENLAETIATTGKTIDQYIGFNRGIDLTINNNKERITSLNDDIADAESYILDQESAMRQRFASLESLVSKLQQQQSSLTSALAGLGN